MQFMTEVIRWLGREFAPYIVQNSGDGLLPGFKVYIVSYDLLSRGKTMERLLAVKPQYLIVDECQHIKNSDSNRAQCVRRLAKEIPHIVACSGTPIKNR